MNSILNHFSSELIHTSKNFEVLLKKADNQAFNLNKDNFLVFEILYYGHATAFYRLALTLENFNSYNNNLCGGNTELTMSFLHEILNTALSLTVTEFDIYEHCTIGGPKSFTSPIFEPQLKRVESSPFDTTLNKFIHIFFHHDIQKTSLSIQLEEQEEQTQEVTNKVNILKIKNDNLQPQKFEALGQLAAGVAHEINTPIQFLCDNLYFLQECFANLDTRKPLDLNFLRTEVPSALKESIESLLRIATIVKFLKNFSHPGSATSKSYSVNKLLENCLAIDESLVDKVFNHFFTTKETGIGTGQGLNISKSIIENRHKESISILSNSKKSICFKIKIGDLKNE